jgi:hypothetical protein
MSVFRSRRLNPVWPLLPALGACGEVPTESRDTCDPGLPAPALAFTGAVDQVGPAGTVTHLGLRILNGSVFPDALFRPAPDLPPCGSNTQSSRTWSETLDDAGTQLYGFARSRRATSSSTSPSRVRRASLVLLACT